MLSIGHVESSLEYHKSPLMYVGLSGWLTKQSKGGYTTNWNRRWFCLIEGSLYYTSGPDMHEEPKLFCHLMQCQLLPFVDCGKDHAFGLWTPVKDAFGPSAVGQPEGAGLGVQLLLACDSADDRFDWLEAIEEHLELPAVEPQDAQVLCEGRYLVLDVADKRVRNAALNQMAAAVHELHYTLKRGDYGALVGKSHVGGGARDGAVGLSGPRARSATSDVGAGDFFASLLPSI